MKFKNYLLQLIVFSTVHCSLLYSQTLVPCNIIDPNTKEKKWGFCDRFYSNVIIKEQYDSTMTFTEGLGRIKLGGRYGFVDSKGKQIIPIKYELADAFSEGLAMVMFDGKSIYIDKKGVDVFNKKFKTGSPFHEGLALVWNEENKAGYIDSKGNLIIPFNYKKAYPFNGGMAPVYSEEEQKWKAINTKGESLFVFNEKVKMVLGKFNEGIVQVYVDGPKGYNVHYDFVNEKGEFICDAPYSSSKEFKDGRAIIAYENKNRPSNSYQFLKYGLIKRGGREIVSGQYACLQESPISGIYFYGKTSASISNCNGYGLLDSMGKELTRPLYKNFTRLNDTTFLCKDVGISRNLLLTTKGKELLSLKSENIEYKIIEKDTLVLLWSKTFDGVYIISVYNTQKGVLVENATKGISFFDKQKLLLIEDWEYASGKLMTLEGKIILDKIQTHKFYGDSTFKGIFPFILFSTNRHEDFKMYNLNTQKIIVNDYGFKDKDNPYYSRDFTEGLLPVQQKGKWGFIDASGKIKLPAIYKSAENFHEGWAVVSKKRKGEYDEDYAIYINKTGKEMIGIKAAYLNASEFNEGIAFYKKVEYGETVRYINKVGKEIFKSENDKYFQHVHFSNGLATVPNKAGKFGYINTKGVLVIPYQFDIPDKKEFPNAIKFDKKGFALVQKDGRKFIIDTTGTEVKK